MDGRMNIARASRLAVVILALLSVAPPARAQDPGEPAATIRLLSQTAWTTPDDPGLRLAVAVRNDGDSIISAPQVVWTIGPKAVSRVLYETALNEGPTFAASADTVSLPEDLGPGESTEARFRIDVSETGGIDTTESAVYPLRIQLTSEGQQIAAITTAAIHLVQQPEQPILFSWWTEIASPVAFAPDGSLIDEGFERTLESGSGIAAQVEAIANLLADTRVASAVDLVVSPAALDQLRQASDGYERRSGGSAGEDAAAPRSAANILRLLRAIATDPEVRVHAMPFAAPRLPSLLSSSLRTDLVDQWRLGDETFERLVGEQADPTVARPPGLAFDQASIDALYARGATTVLGAPDSVLRPAQPSGFAPPPAATLSTSTGSRVAIVLPDPGTQALLADPQLLEDPVRAAQAVLGELATIWRERPVPGDDTVRGLALDLPPDLPAAMWRPLVRRLSQAPFLQGVHAEDLPNEMRPPPETASLERRAQGGFSADYVRDLSVSALDVTAVAAMLEEPANEAESLQRAILYAEASQYIGNEGSGRVWINSVNGVTEQIFHALAPDTSRPLTFTSRSGKIPLRMGDPGDRVLNVTVQLSSGRVEFLDGSSRPVRLDRANKVITFEAEVKAAGPTRIDVLVRSPSGFVLSRSVLVVRSTAVNPIALIITVGAGLILVGLWSRRLFRRRSR
jgi:hypothetical protein